MSVEALWTAQFEIENAWSNGGVVVLETGRIYGGDSQYYYLGSYVVNGSRIDAEINVTHYFGNIYTAWGTSEKSFKVKLEGKIEDKVINAIMFHPSHPSVTRKVVLSFKESLP